MSSPESYLYRAAGERHEYNQLSPDDLSQYMEYVQDEIEFLFEHINAGEDIKNTFSADREMHIRQTFIDSAHENDEVDDSSWLFDTTNGNILFWDPKKRDASVHLELRHLHFRESPYVNEEYLVKIERKIQGTTAPFMTFYQFTHHKDGGWNAEVDRHNISPMTEQGEGNRYTRQMSAYDFDEFFKDMGFIQKGYLNTEAKLLRSSQQS